MKYVRFILIFMGISLLAGCATQPNKQLDDPNFFRNNRKVIRIAAVKPIASNVYHVGQEGLLDMVINHAVNNQFEKYVEQNTNTAWYVELPHKFKRELEIRRAPHSYHYGYAENSYESSMQQLARQYPNDIILLVELHGYGAIRNYHGFIPLGDPRAYCDLSGQLYSMENGKPKLLWYHRTKLDHPISGSWDQPPSYPNATNSIVNASRAAQNELLGSLFTH